jgi:HEAT repeat protein
MSLDAGELRALRDRVRSPDPRVRDAAIERLRAVIDESAWELVQEALRSDNPEVRAHAERLLDRLTGGSDA